MSPWVVGLIFGCILFLAIVIFTVSRVSRLRKAKKYERGLKMTPLLIHLPPTTDDIEAGGRDKRDVTNEAVSKAQVMYSILSSVIEKGFKIKLYGQNHFSFEIIAKDGFIRYYAIVPADLKETVKQSIQSAYPTARVEERREENIFEGGGNENAVVGAELSLRKEPYLPIATYEDTKRDAQMAMLNALSNVDKNEGASVQILFRPAQKNWFDKAKTYIENTQKGIKTKTIGASLGDIFSDIIRAPFEVPGMHEKTTETTTISSIKQEELTAITNKMRFPAFETLIRLIASSESKPRSEAILSGLAASFSQFDSPELNGFKINTLKDPKKLAIDYTFRVFPVRTTSNILNSVELASIFHLPEQNAIPNSQVERQLTKQVDGPARLATEGVLLGTNEFRGVKKPIYLDDDDRRRHMYVIGQTGMGKSVFLENIAYQDMCDGRGFAFIDPHGDAVEALLQRVPEERIDDVIYFDPADIEHPVGMNMFEYTSEDQKDFIVQEGISMLQSLFDPSNQGFFGPRGQHMFRNAALLLMADPKGATFIDIPQCFTDPEFVKSKLKYVTDKAVYDYWTKEFPASQKSNDAGEVITWFASKWGPFLSNTIMRNTLGQVKSGFNIREIMDNKKIFLVNLSKGRLGDINANLLGMIFVMKFQQAAMSRQDIPEHERKDFCLYVDEFQNFATDSFESILSEARKYRLNLIVANQFMTQLTDKIREALLGNVGTIICGRVGVTDADLMVKAFTPTFTAEDLTKTANHSAICKVMMFGMPSSPFTMNLPAPMGEPNVELMNTLKVYSATKFAKTRSEVEQEIQDRWSAADKEKEALAEEDKKKGFLDGWLEKKSA
ncbi:TraM recognition domain-containing protein [Candidatus Saccharibacteria bacterium]|nr:TraM recognition domain-containing protein [Candidatus Saccharibacteria bacterium]